MTCASCAGIVEDAISKVPGVLSTNVNLATEKARVVYEPAVVGPDQILAAVRAAGYDLTFDQTTLGIKGMTCASCAGIIESSLLNLDGVLSASVNLATEKVAVRYNPEAVTIPTIKAAIVDRRVRGAGGRDPGPPRWRNGRRSSAGSCSCWCSRWR